MADTPSTDLAALKSQSASSTERASRWVLVGHRKVNVSYLVKESDKVSQSYFSVPDKMPEEKDGALDGVVFLDGRRQRDRFDWAKREPIA